MVFESRRGVYPGLALDLARGVSGCRGGPSRLNADMPPPLAAPRPPPLPTAASRLTAVPARDSLISFAVQMLTPARIIASTNGRKQVGVTRGLRDLR